MLAIVPSAGVVAQHAHAHGLDSAVFVTLAFAGTGAPLLETIVVTWLIKVAWETAATPLTYAVVNRLKRSEGVDVYERPSLNPLAARG
jgi:uncharacterized PurR-regulated membrane protein YhhQ (DUF165 family)